MKEEPVRREKELYDGFSVFLETKDNLLLCQCSELKDYQYKSEFNK